MAKHTFETIEKKRNQFFQRVLTFLLAFTVLFTVCYIVGLAATRHNTRVQVEPTTEVNADETDETADVQPGKQTDKQENTPSDTAEPQVPSNGHTIYLTFDDGPGEYTAKLLDILKKHDAKVTFFVTHAYPKYESLLKREKKEGHAIGVHSYSHRYDDIYASDEAYWNDFDQMQQVIVKQTGEETTLMRFPGGSSNTVSNATPGIMTKLVAQSKQKGLHYFDWNVASGDAGATTSSAAIVQNCKVGAANYKNAVILCHDVKEYTVNAMDEFITWGLENGYTFAALTPDSPGAHHKVFN